MSTRHPNPRNANPLDVLRFHVTGAVERGEAQSITAVEYTGNVVWCDNPRHGEAAHKEIWDTAYKSSDAAAGDPMVCHYPHLANAPTAAPYAWGITYDHLAHTSGGAAGPRNVDSVLLARLKEAVKAGRKHASEFPDVEWFRMYDDDGELYFTGVRTAILEPWSEDQSSEDGFEPLDDYGTPAAGATEIRYLKPEHASQSASDEVWETL